MIGTLIRVSATNLRRDRVAQMMVFVVPVVFFTIFASVFGRQTTFSTSRIRVAVADEARTARSAALIEALRADTALRVFTSVEAGDAKRGAPELPVTAARAESLVRAGRFAVALVLPAGLDTSLMRLDGGGAALPLLVDPSDPVASQMVNGPLQRAALRVLSKEASAASSLGGGPAFSLGNVVPARTEVRKVLGQAKQGNGMIAFYAAGIAVMFLLFSCNAGAGALLDETESGTLERVLTTRVGMGTLLAGKWMWLTLLGAVQVAVMFAWGMVAFRLPLMAHLPGFALVTVITAACAAAFGLMMAAACRTRAQLQGISTLVVLSLSAIGGSMFPRFLMPESLQKFSLVGFNAWALDAYLDVFWRSAPFAQLAPRLAALAGFTVLFLVVARRLARRWEVA